MLTFAILILSIWTIINFTDMMLKSCLVEPYLAYLSRKNINVKLFRIQWFTSRYNRYFNSHTRKTRPLWFHIGALVTLLLLPLSIYFLWRTLYSLLAEFFQLSDATPSEMDLTPALPGVNLPISDLPFYLLTLVLCSLLHELGHALAASREGVRINGVGAFVVLIFPGAYVDLPSDVLESVSPWRRLKIFTAGVWHNLVIVGVAWGLLWSHPVILSPVFRQGVSVVSVAEDSGAAGAHGLWPGDEITGVNDCNVENFTDWSRCLTTYMSLPQLGGCISSDYIMGAGTPTTAQHCCFNHTSVSDLCFLLQPNDKIKSECLPVRRTLLKFTKVCINATSCGNNEFCAVPRLEHKSHRLVTVRRNNVRQDMLFLGPLEELWKAVRVISYVPRSPLVSANTVYYWETLLRYLVSFSGALAILNVIPCYCLDGQWILGALIELLFGRMNPSFNQKIYNSAMFMGTSLVGVTVTLGLRKLLYLV